VLKREEDEVAMESGHFTAAPIKSRSVALDRSVAFLAVSGYPARKGGFDALLSALVPRLIAEYGWTVTVYVMQSSEGESQALVREVLADGAIRVSVPRPKGRIGLARYLKLAYADAYNSHRCQVVCSLGYMLWPYLAFRRVLRAPRPALVVNVAGLEWRRASIPWWVRVYVYVGARTAKWYVDSIVADSKAIGEYYWRHFCARSSYIPYGPLIADCAVLPKEELGNYYVVVSRCMQENNLEMIIEGFIGSETVSRLLVICDTAGRRYGKTVRRVAATDPRIVMYGPEYDQDKLLTLRLHAKGYIHGHSVGGTNPSLVEAMGCGNLVIAHDNVFNREVLGTAGCYFSNAAELSNILNDSDSPGRGSELDAKRMQAVARIQSEYSWESIAKQYNSVLERATKA
jgi:glycosyltransferase involved in cell wall biosynthesis